MFNPFKNLGDIAALQKQAQQMQKALQQEEVMVEKDGVKVVLSGDQQIKEVIIDGIQENRVTMAINQAIKETQKLAATKLMQMSSQQGS